jgi:acyl-CoA reductase-like NAD-dependent aldehyde dehydrogenase
MAADDDLFDKAIEGFVMFAFNSGEVCTCPSRALIEESIYEKFMERALVRVKAIKKGNPLDTSVALGAQNSALQLERIMGHVSAAHKEGAECLIGGVQATLPGAEGGGFYVEPTIFKSNDHNLRIFQDEVFGPVLAVTTFKTEAEALKIANDSSYGLGAGVWTRDVNIMHRMGRGIQAGHIWVRPPLLFAPASPQIVPADQFLSRAAKLLPCLSCRRHIRRLQVLRTRTGDAQGGAGRISAGEVPAAVVFACSAWLLLSL